MEKISYGVYKIPLILNESVGISKNQLSKKFANAQISLKNFAKKYGWEDQVRKPFVKKVYVFGDQSNLKARLVEITNAKTDDFPEKISAVIIDKKLYILSPDEYKNIYPEVDENNYYEKLITHELAHQLHLRILDGQDESMGPIWFYEGFAIFAADQFSDYKLNSSDIWKIINSKKRVSYKYYGAVVRFFLEKISLNKLVENAKRDDFVDWIEGLKIEKF